MTSDSCRQGLESLWLKVTSRPLWLPPNLFRFLRLRRNVALRPLTANDIQVTAPAGIGPNCRACADNCCVGKRSTVSLRLVDVAALIDLERTDLMTQKKPTFGPSDLNPALALTTQSTTFQRLPVLAQDEHGRCAALTPLNRCSLYPHWPLSCARFPYALDLDDGEVFYSSRCPSHQALDSERRKTMIDATLAAYNERIRDLILLEYAPEGLRELGIGRFLRAHRGAS